MLPPPFTRAQLMDTTGCTELEIRCFRSAGVLGESRRRAMGYVCEFSEDDIRVVAACVQVYRAFLRRKTEWFKLAEKAVRAGHYSVVIHHIEGVNTIVSFDIEGINKRIKECIDNEEAI